MSKTLRNNTLDVAKLLASFLVVFIHVPFYGIFGEIVKCISRVAVPLFFMTSGYFSFQNDTKTIVRKIKKLVSILIFTSILYNVLNVAVAFLSDGLGGIKDYLLGFADIGAWLKLIFFNLPFSATRLWFLFALIYVYILQLLFNKLKFSYKLIFIISICGLVIHFLLGDVLVSLGINVPDYLGRNFLFFGYPFFGLGLIFRKEQEKIEQANDKTLIICAVLGVLLSLAPLLYNTVSQISFGTLLLIFAVFAFSLKKCDTTYPDWILTLCKCSLGIYIFHKPVTTILNSILSFLNLSGTAIISGILLPPFVCIVTTVLVLILQMLERKIKHK